MKRGAGILLLAVTCFLLGLYGGRIIPESHTISDGHLADQIAIIDNYLINSAQNNWDEVLPLLSGEALHNAQNNLVRTNSKQRTELLNTELMGAISLGEYLILDMTVTTAGGSGNVAAFDRQSYRFHVLDNKIFSIEQLPSLSFFNTSQEKITTTKIPAAENAVLTYLALIEENNWEDALSMLTGQARRMGLGAVSTMPWMPDLYFADLTVETLGQIGDTTCFVLAKYGSMGSDMRVLFVLESFEKEWRIKDIQLVSV